MHELDDRSVIPMRTLTLWRCEARVSPVLLCRHHHRMIHTGSLTVEMIAGRPRFYDGLGMVVTNNRWRPPEAPAA